MSEHYYRVTELDGSISYESRPWASPIENAVEITEKEYNEAIAALEVQDEPTDDEATAEDFEAALRDIGVIA